MAYKLRDLADSLDGVIARGAGARLVPTPGSMVSDFMTSKPTTLKILHIFVITVFVITVLLDDTYFYILRPLQSWL